MKTIVYVMPKIKTGGGYTYVRGLTEKLYKKFNIVWISGKFDKRLLVPYVSFYSVGAITAWNIFAALRFILILQRLCNRQEKIIVHFNGRVTIWLRIAYIIFHFWITHKTISIYTAHGFHFYNAKKKVNLISKFMIFIEKIVTRQMDVMQFTSESEKQIFYKCGITGKKDIVIYHGISVRELYKVRKDKNIEIALSKFKKFIKVVYVARFHVPKNHFFLLDIVSVLKKKRIKNIKFILVGSGKYYTTFVQKMQETELNKYFKLLGRLDKNGVITAFRMADIYVHTSLWESTVPFTMLEAYAFKLPVVALDVEGVREGVVTKGNNTNGFLISSRSTSVEEEFASKLIYLSRHAKIRKIMGNNSYKLLHSFRKQDWIHNMQKLYANL